MSSELAVVANEIVTILPREKQTPQMTEWVEAQLSEGNTPSDMLAYCKDAFGIVASKIANCESKIEKHGVKLDAHIKYTDQKFDAVHDRLSKVETQLAVTTAVNDERNQQNQFLSGQLMSSQTAIQGSIANVAAKSNRGSSDTNHVALFFGLAFGVIILSCMVAFVGIRPQSSQVIEYKNVPSNGHPTPVPREQYDRL